MTTENIELEARVARLRQQAGSLSFEEGFTDRVMGRLSAQRPLSEGLERAFGRLVPFAAAAALLLGAINLLSTRSSGQPVVERFLGLPEVTLSAAYSIDGITLWGESSR